MMTFMQQFFTTSTWLSLHNSNPVQTEKRRISDAYKRGTRTCKTLINLEENILNHIQSLEEKKIKYSSQYNSALFYDQKQVEFWKSHAYEISDMVLHRSVIFSNNCHTNVDSGLAVSLLAS